MMNAVTPNSTASAGADRLDAVALWYLALPNLIFLGTYLKQWIGIPAVVVLACVLLLASRGAWRIRTGVAPLAWIAVSVFAVVWLLVSGIGHFLYANPDWIVRDVVLHDLATRPWPVQYNVIGDAVPVLLRAPLGYFLPAAFLAKFFGPSLSTPLLFIWTFVGVMISCMLMSSRQKSLGGVIIVVLIFAFFSGMDIVGYLWLNDSITLGQHIEWWAQYFQYSSVTTQLFWVPNHALPGWIVAAWMMKHMDARTFSVRWIVLLVAMTPLWSPLAAIGLGFITAIVLVARILFREGGGAPLLGQRLLELLDPPMLAGAAIFLALIAPFLLMASETVPSGSLGHGRELLAVAPRVFTFVMVEFGLFWILMLRRYRTDLLLTTSAVLLLILPWLRFGPNSDLTMRASIPALLIFAVRLGEWFTERLLPGKGEPVKEDALASIAMVVFVIGMATPFQEIIRAFMQPAEPVDTSQSMYGQTNGGATHYLAARSGRYAESILASGDASAGQPREMHVVAPGTSGVEQNATGKAAIGSSSASSAAAVNSGSVSSVLTDLDHKP